MKRLILELGLRYRPSAQADLESHSATIALLAQDVADVPPHLLEQAIRQHVLNSPYLPKASDLIAIARGLLPARTVTNSALSLAQRYNARMDQEQGARRDILWRTDESGAPYLDWAQ